MNTRSFLKSLAAIAIAPQILIPRAPDACKWVRVAVLNPAYSDAPYELAFIDALGPVTENMFVQILSRRYALGKNGLWEEILPP